MTNRGSIPVALAVVGLCVAFTTACSSMVGGASGAGGRSGAPSPSSGTASGTASGAGNPTASSPAPVTCTAAQLAVEADGSGVAGGQAELLLEITNKGTAACTLSGYPAVVGRLPSGAAVRGADTVNVMLGIKNPVSGPSPVAIGPGAQAWVPLNFVDTPVNGATSCPSFSSFTFTPPGVDRTYTIRASGADCAGFKVPPVLPAADVVIPSGG